MSCKRSRVSIHENTRLYLERQVKTNNQQTKENPNALGLFWKSDTDLPEKRTAVNS